METGPLARELTPDHLADHMRHGLSDPEARAMSPHHLAYHERVGDLGIDSASLFLDATADHPPRTHPSNSQYQVIPSENYASRKHHRRTGAVAIPLEDFGHQCNRHAHHHHHHHSGEESAKICQERRYARRREAIQRGAILRQENRQAEVTEDEQARSIRASFGDLFNEYSGTTSARIDPHCFYRKAQRQFSNKVFDKKINFAPRPCSYTSFQYSEDCSKITVTSRLVHGPELLDLVSKPRSLGYHCELRLIMSPENANEPADKHYVSPHASTPFPFDPVTCETFFNICDFHRAFFETAIAEHSHVIKNARLNMERGIHSFFLGLGDAGRYNMKIFISYKECDRVTTVFIHDCSASEKQHLQDRLSDESLQALTLDPIFILVIIAEKLHDTIWRDIKEAYHDAIKPIHEAGTFGAKAPPFLDATDQSAKGLKTSHFVYANQWRLEQLREFMRNLTRWSKEIDDKDSNQKTSFRTARKVMEDRLTYLDGSLEEASLQVVATIHYISIYRHWVDVHIANSANKLSVAIAKSSHQMTLDGRRDQSAAKLLSIIGVLFLPATFFCSIFSLPFFNWKADKLTQVINRRIAIFIIASVTTTAAVVMLWRFWFRFEKWRLTHGRGRSIRKDVKSWVRGGFKQYDKKTLERRERKKDQILHETGGLDLETGEASLPRFDGAR